MSLDLQLEQKRPNKKYSNSIKKSEFDFSNRIELFKNVRIVIRHGFRLFDRGACQIGRVQHVKRVVRIVECGMRITTFRFVYELDCRRVGSRWKIVVSTRIHCVYDTHVNVRYDSFHFVHRLGRCWGLIARVDCVVLFWQTIASLHRVVNPFRFHNVYFPQFCMIVLDTFRFVYDQMSGRATY